MKTDVIPTIFAMSEPLEGSPWKDALYFIFHCKIYTLVMLLCYKSAAFFVTFTPNNKIVEITAYLFCDQLASQMQFKPQAYNLDFGTCVLQKSGVNRLMDSCRDIQCSSPAQCEWPGKKQNRLPAKTFSFPGAMVSDLMVKAPPLALTILGY